MDELKKKLGPLPLWQWIAIGAAVGLAVAWYRKTHSSSASDAAAAVTPSDAEYNPIDPTTGMPIAGGISGGAATDPGVSATAPVAAGSGGDLSDLLNNFSALEQLLGGLQALAPAGPAVDTSGDTISVATGVTGAKGSPLERAKAALASGKLGPVNRQRLKAAGYTDSQLAFHLKSGTPLGKPGAKQHPKKTSSSTKNPGHTVTHHGGGKKTASSSAPHNPRQHVNTQAPSHQRHPATQHPSATHPAAKKTPPKPKTKAKGKH